MFKPSSLPPSSSQLWRVPWGQMGPPAGLIGCQLCGESTDRSQSPPPVQGPQGSGATAWEAQVSGQGKWVWEKLGRKQPQAD